MTISLRRENGADEPFLRRLIVENVTEELGAECWPEPMRSHLTGIQYDARRQAVRAHFPGGESNIIGADGEDVGWLFVAWLPDEVRLAEIMVAAEHRGKGIGEAVTQSVIDSAAGKPVRLYVNVTNTRAIRFYDRMGFRRAGGDEVQHLMEHRAARPC